VHARGKLFELADVGLGAISGYFAGKIDFMIQKLVEVIWTFPPLPRHRNHGVLRPGLGILILAMVAQRWIPYFRVARGCEATRKID
jgi:peptide/nickel transport system permease protein